MLESKIKKTMKDKYDIQIGGPGGGYEDIAQTLRDNPDLQQKVFEELSYIYADFDIANNTNFSEAFMLNFTEGLYKTIK